MALKLTKDEARVLLALQSKGATASDIIRTIKTKNLYDIHTANPTWGKGRLAEEGFSIQVVAEYWKSFVDPNPVYQIKDWDDVIEEGE